MKRVFAGMAMLALVALAASASASEIIIGTGTSSWQYPLATVYHDARTQTIYLAGEIGGAFQISALSLDVTTTPGQTMNSFTIRMKHTSLSSYSTASWESSGLTTVYQANENITTTGWKTFAFTTPFDYNGSDNLMVDISFNNSSWTSDGQCRYSTPGGNRTIYYRTDSGYGDPLTWSGSTPAPSSTAYVPNVRLESGNTVATPTFSPDGGIYYSPQCVTMSCATGGAVIHYTTNGSVPTCGSATYTSCVQVNTSQTVRAIACKDGMDPSAVKSADYTIREPIVVYVSTAGSDLDGDGSLLNPWKTIQYAVSQIDDKHAIVHVMPGTYNEQVIVPSIAEGLSLLGSGADVTTIDAFSIPYNGGVIKLLAGKGYVISGFTLTGGTYEDSGSPGGAVRGLGDVSARVENNVIIDNFSYGYDMTGGGISLGPDCEILNNRFINNSARYGSGAVYVGPRSLIMDNIFEGNSSDSFRGGGAIESSDASVVISRNVFLNNNASYEGGAFSGSATLSNNLFIANSAASGYGGAAYLTGGSFVNNALVGNIGDPQGSASGVYVAAQATVQNNIIVNGIGGVGIYVPTGLSISNDYNDIWNNDLGQYGGSATPGPHNIHADPKLVSIPAGDYHLLPTSPCINVGLSSAVQPGSLDMDGEPRILPTEGIVDIGADEFTFGNTPPTVSISTPSESSTLTGPVTYTITYGGADTITLSDSDVTLNKTGTASGTAGVSGTGNTTRTVTVSSITGDGTLGISIAAGTASNSLGAAYAAGPSATFIAGNLPPVYVSVDGSDEDGDGSLPNPWKTIQYAVNQIYRKNATVNVMPGTYNGQVIVQSIAEGLRLLGSGADVTTIDASGLPSNGGVIKLPAGSGYVISGFTLTGGTCEGSGSPGGAIRGADVSGWDESTVSARVENNVIIENFSYGYDMTGGGISLGPDCEILSNRFIGNGARYGSGAVYVGPRSLIMDNIFEGNSAGESGGGAIESSDASVVISRNVFLNNSSGSMDIGYGGAFYGKATVSNNLFIANSAAGYNAGYGGAAYLTGGSFVNNTLVGNIGDPQGSASGVYVAAQTTVRNNIIVNGIDGVGIYIPTGLSISNDYNDIWNNDLGPYGGSATPGPHNIHADPKFVDLAAGNYRLLPTSLCINVGLNSVESGSLDMDGQPRIQGGIVDIGAYESDVPPADLHDIASAKTALDGKMVDIPSAVVTAVFDGYFYIESSNRASGIRVEEAVHTAAKDTIIGVWGMTATNTNGERYIAPSYYISTGNNETVQPLGMTVKSLGGGPIGVPPAGQAGVQGGSGLNNIGLLVRVCGKASFVDGSTFTVDDGSRAPVECKIAQDSVGEWINGKSVIVTGVCSCRSANSAINPVILLRDTNDLRVLGEVIVQGRTTAGGQSQVNYSLESLHPYSNSSNINWTIPGPAEATSMRVHFTKVELEGYCDYLYVKNSAGTTVQTFNNYPAVTDVWSNWVTGNTIKLNLTSDSSVQRYGFQIDKYEIVAPSVPLSGATVTLSPGDVSVITGMDGRYVFTGLLAGTYSVTPSLSGATFSPPSRSVTLLAWQIISGIDFQRN